MTEPADRVSLRIAEFAITNFRTFRERTVIPLSTEQQADPLVVFHGGNGAGKSNALAALDLFFRAITHWMGWRSGTSKDYPPELRCGWEQRQEPQGFIPNRRDWPPGSTEIMYIEVRFSDEALNTFRVQLQPAGTDLFLTASFSKKSGKVLADTTEQDYVNPTPDECKSLRNLLETPRGARSRALFILDAHRRGSWGSDEQYDRESLETLSPLIAEKLFRLRVSLEPGERQRWKFFQRLLGQFSTLKEKEVSIDIVKRGSIPELFFEDPGRQILRLVELSSGEQQLVTLCAAIATSQASLVAIAEPEISLSEKNQQTLRSILEEQVGSKLVDQIILESHVYTFDGPEVIRFRREGSVTRVSREPRPAEEADLTARAQSAGAQKQYVTPEGFTHLPENMRRDLGLETGGRIWFLKEDKRWSAWKTEELDTLFGFSGKQPKES